ncbi:hypothetical protein PCL_10831 [Purpureocillium lilacinum]|uniref:Uncharacterized protein n=1 Tax=Purpureocillium lilacinum TaxID=33203 RepID=A0A2U3ECI2_PURLI|nr:hypothetical protein PCL_10831 [Purpureocillium lilacinum]
MPSTVFGAYLVENKDIGVRKGWQGCEVGELPPWLFHLANGPNSLQESSELASQGRSVATQVTVICWSSTIPGAGRAGTNTQLRLYGEHRLHGYFDSCLRLPCRARHNSTPQANKEAEAAAAGTWKHETIVVQLTGRRNRWCAFRNVVDANPGKATLETGWFHCPPTGAVGDQE